ncbi:LOW QUALITY PROTEIN: disintegrin and metalloproteinase domain-containing protein 1-like [Puma concolor]|uniref:LOW QUALITY PROTEIN: disintegrin and metalloproteinase domain-containing protein 1-like n=1 Tax=Puma concolor TaxID=9696 RepID=A0A6P6IML5_PUMCO|nr:LOW QUALITY PROTEIN: disintegrin and metalloproteinase domain-containing protein 1-like [Puma concolor]
MPVAASVRHSASSLSCLQKYQVVTHEAGRALPTRAPQMKGSRWALVVPGPPCVRLGIMLVLALIFLPTLYCDLGSVYYSSYETVIPKSLTVKGREDPVEKASYMLLMQGQKWMIHLKAKRDCFVKDFPVFSYHGGVLGQEMPFISHDCHYEGYIEGVPGSFVSLNTCSGLRGILIKEGSPLALKNHILSTAVAVKTGGLAPSILTPLDEGGRLVGLAIKSFLFGQCHKQNLRNEALKMLKEHRERIDPSPDLATGTEADAVEGKSREKGTQLSEGLREIREGGAEAVSQPVSCGVTSKGRPSEASASLVAQGSGEASTVPGIVLLLLNTKYVESCVVNNQRFQMWGSDVSGNPEGHGHHRSANSFTGEINRGVATGSSDYFYQFLRNNKASCLFTKLAPNDRLHVRNAECGNGVLEDNEECDCGPDCGNNRCCDQTCRLKENAKCSPGPCCNETCGFAEKGFICRPALGECDLPEYCDGTTAICPHDTYKQDGTTCERVHYCVQGVCRTPDIQCLHVFGYPARSAPEDCYISMNTKGDRFGNCGFPTSPRSEYIKCEDENIYCGKIICTNIKHVPEIKPNQTMIQVPHKDDFCWSMDVYDITDIPDNGYVHIGTLCAPEKICMNRSCTDHAVLNYDCEPKQMCNGRGVCNNLKHCHCEAGYAPPNCKTAGNGGSVDSGSPSAPHPDMGFSNCSFDNFHQLLYKH